MNRGRECVRCAAALLGTLLAFSACQPTEQVVARVETLPTEGATAMDAGVPGEPASSAGAAAPAGAPAPPTSGTAAPPTPGLDSSCATLAHTFGLLYEAVHVNNCRGEYDVGDLGWAELIAVLLTVREAFSTPFDAGAPGETRQPMGCDYPSGLRGAPGYPDFNSDPPVYVLCPDACQAAEQWLLDKRDEYMACAAAGNP